jgi:hypothetical protein
MKSILVLGVLIPVLMYVVVAGIAWQFRNPLANRATFWTHLPEALTFQKMPYFQIKEDQ